MPQAQLSQRIDDISAEFMLMDPDCATDMDTMVQHVTALKKAAHRLPSLTDACATALSLLKEMMGQPPEVQSRYMDALGDLLTHMQILLRDTRSGETANQGEVTDTIPPAVEGRPPSLNENTGINHPDKLPEYLDNEVFAQFLSLQPEILQKMESLILDLEQTISDEKIKELKRYAHTAKGEAGFMNLKSVERLLHKTEDLLELPYSPDITDTLLSVVDWLKRAYQVYAGKPGVEPPVEPILSSLETCMSDRKESDIIIADSDQDIEAVTREWENALTVQNTPLPLDTTWQNKLADLISHRFEALDSHLLTLSTDPEDDRIIHHIFCIMWEIQALADFFNQTAMALVARETAWFIAAFLRLSDLPLSARLNLVFEAVDTLKTMAVDWTPDRERQASAPPSTNPAGLLCQIRAALRGESPPLPAPMSVKTGQKIGDILVDSGLTNQHIVDSYKTEQASGKSNEKLGEMLVRDGKVRAKDVSMALQSQRSTREESVSVVREPISVDADRLDRIVNSIGELVIVESMVFQSPEIRNTNSKELARHIVTLDKITRELQETGLSLRMVPVRSLFQKMSRVARDVSKKAGKRIQFLTSGEDTELDKTIVDKLNDPLMHMVRNAIDHGIEDNVQKRMEKGKTDMGTITLRAFHKGSNIVIEVADDGKGIDPNHVLKKAQSLNLVTDAHLLSERDMYQFIFEPGFSTAQTVTDLSGRGVGMNVVKESIDALRGTIDIQSHVDQGSVFSINIPLTLAIIDGMIVRIDHTRFIIPTLSIVMSATITKKDKHEVMDRGEMAKIQNELIPIIRLNELFENNNGPSGGEATEFAVIVENGDKKAAVIVDELIGKQQIVIKSLGEFMGHLSGISGGAILQDGVVGLIIDVAGLLKMIDHRQQPDSK